MILTVLSAPASISTLERIGIVFRRSTTDWTWPRQRSRLARSIVAFIDIPYPPCALAKQRPKAGFARERRMSAISLATGRRAASGNQGIRRFLGDNSPPFVLRARYCLRRTSPYHHSHGASGR